VPLACRAAHRIAAGLLDTHDPSPVPSELARRERAREIAGEVDHQRPPERLHRPRTYHYPATALGERATGAEEKRRLILDAAAHVFARKGFHASRVGDIAEEAGVAHGLLYHYFDSKDEVLDTIFREHWEQVLERLHAAETSPEPPEQQLRSVAHVLLRGWLREPDVVSVVIREIARSAHLAERATELLRPVGVIRRIIERGQAAGDFRRDLDAETAAIVFYGGIDELISGWVLGRLVGDERDVANAERHVVGMQIAALAPSADELGEARRADVTA
jgi:AcrR family transcriptional regulator